VLLAAAGFPALRFDYFGCGDSAGECEAGTIGDWIANTQVAAAEVCEKSGATRQCLFGLRLGGAFACTAAQGGGVDSLVLWNPVLNGNDYLAELMASQSELLASVGQVHSDGSIPDQVYGFPLTSGLAPQIQAIDLSRDSFQEAKHVLLVDTNPTEERLHRVMAGRSGPHFHYERMPIGSPFWLVDPSGVMVPRQVLELIVAWLSEVYS
jgi:hypothetical protein